MEKQLTQKPQPQKNENENTRRPAGDWSVARPPESTPSQTDEDPSQKSNSTVEDAPAPKDQPSY